MVGSRDGRNEGNTEGDLDSIIICFVGLSDGLNDGLKEGLTVGVLDTGRRDGISDMFGIVGGEDMSITGINVDTVDGPYV